MHNGCTILHIEDDEADHILFKRDLQKLAFSGDYVRVPSFEQARQYLANPESKLPSLIIADSKLGIYNGLDIVRWAKGEVKLHDIPVVVYSTAVAPQQKKEVLGAGAAACLTKPIDSRETLTALEMILSYVDSRCQVKADEKPA